MFIDSHCHLNRNEYADDVGQVIERAKAAGVGHMLTVCTLLEEAQGIIDLANNHDELYCSVGVHPHDAAPQLEMYDVRAELEKHATNPKVVALGETGLDFYYDHSPHDQQIKAFEIHIELSKKLKLPLIIHTRDADAETIQCMQKEAGNITGVMHCFSGTMKLARQSLDLGFYISISGIVTFKNADVLREVVSYVPEDRLLVETDAPFLAPVPYRGKRNEPAFMIETAKKVAELRGLELNDLASITTENFKRLFLNI